MNTALRSTFEEITDLLKDGREPLARVLLDKIDLRAIDDLSDLICSEYYYLRAWCSFTEGEYAPALSRVKAALRLSRASADHLLFAREKQLPGAVFLRQGRPRDAVEAFTETYSARKRAGDYANVYGSLVNLGLAHFAGDDLKQAKTVLDDALSYARKYNGAAEIRLCQFNQSLVALFSGDFAEFRSIIEEIRSEPLGVLDTAHVVKRVGQLAVFMMDHESTRQNLKDALVVYTRSHIRREQAVCLEYLGLNEYFQGNYRKAKEYYEQVLAMPEPTASAVAQTLRMLTDVYVAEGDFTTAMETAVKAEAAITKINERIELGALYRAYGQIYEHQGDQPKAREYFSKSIDLLHQLGARYELALSYFACGQSQCCSGELRLDHLQKSKSLFFDIEVPKRVAQVGQAIVDLNKASVKPHSKRNHKNPGESSIVDPDILTEDPEMKRVLGEAFQLAQTDVTILITGETGTGKDLLAERIHCLSDRKAGPFVNANMAELSHDLVESELFGHEKGSYTGADKKRVGLIESANGGTFCINQVEMLSCEMQGNFLHVLEERSVRPVGGREPHAIDIRFIAITNVDLKERAAAGLFRPDLYQRLKQGQLHLPPLRDRNGDLPLLTQFFLKRLGFGDYDLDQTTRIVENCGLDLCPWTGNVRELQNVLQEVVALTGKGSLTELLGRLKLKMQRPSNGDSADSERAKLVEALKRNRGNHSKAAKELGINRTTLAYRLRRLGLS